VEGVSGDRSRRKDAGGKAPGGPGGARPPAKKGRPRRSRFSWGVQLYIGREVLRSFALIFAAFQVIMCCIFGIGAVRDLGVDIGFILPLLVPAVAMNINATIPVSLLFATSLVYGRLIADREVAALKSFGLSYLDLAFLPAALGGTLGAIMVVLNLWVLPELRFTEENIGGMILDQLLYLGDGWNRTFPIRDDYTLWIEHYEGSRLTGIFIGAEKASAIGLRGIDGEPGQGAVRSRSYPFFFYAAEGEVVRDPDRAGKTLSIELRGLSVYFDSDLLGKGTATDFIQRLDLGRWQLPVAIPEAKKKARELPLPALRRRIADLEKAWTSARDRGVPPKEWAKPLSDYRWAITEIHRRICFGIMVFGFPLAAACLALFLNSSNRLLPVFVSLMMVPAVFYFLEMLGNNQAVRGHAPAFFQELGNIGLLALSGGLFLTLRRRTLW
jgi:lipopolysaccharide export LptBFGC system permease protein LptF